MMVCYLLLIPLLNFLTSYLEFLSKKDNGRQSVALVAENQKPYNTK